MLKRAIAFLAVAMGAAAPVMAAGLVTHATMAQRAAYYYSLDKNAPGADLIRAYPDDYYSGAVFPDWGFTPDLSLKSPDGMIHKPAGEEAHWTPWMRIAAEYVHAKPKPWDQPTQRLVAFLLGAMVHDSSDISWHNLGCSAGDPTRGSVGMLRAMAGADFAVDNEKAPDYDAKVSTWPPFEFSAHEVGDRSGDAVVGHRQSMAFLPKTVVFPIDDLLAIYKRCDAVNGTTYNVTKEQLEAGRRNEQTYVAFYRLAERSKVARESIDKYYQFAAHWSPYLIEHFEDHYFGGLDHGAIVAALRFPVLMHWFHDGVPGGGMGLDSLFCLVSQPSAVTAASEGVDAPGARPTQSVYSGGASFPPLDEAMRVLSAEKDDAAAIEVSSVVPPQGAFAYAGTALAVSRGGRRAGHESRGDLNHDGIDDLVVGIPGTSGPQRPAAGSVAIYYGRADDAPLGMPDLVLSAPDRYSRFGAAVAVLDLDADGFDDLIVGAPAHGSAEIDPDVRARGRVYVYFGFKDRPGVPATPDRIIDEDQPRVGPRPNTNFGSGLYAFDCDGDGFDDLIVASPFGGTTLLSGEVSIWLARPSIRKTIERPDWTAFGAHRGDRFGSSVTLAVREGKRLLAVGSPGAKQVNGTTRRQDAGAVSWFDLSSIGKGRVNAATPWENAPAAERFSEYGASIAAGRAADGGQIIAIGIPIGSFDGSQRQLGGVFVVAAADEGKLLPVSLLQGEREYARFGWQVAFADVSGDGIDDLIVSEPMDSSAQADAGTVYVWSGTKLPKAISPDGIVLAKPSTATWTFRGGVRRGEFGRSFVAMNVRNPRAKPRLAIASPFDSTTAPMAGSVRLVTVSGAP